MTNYCDAMSIDDELARMCFSTEMAATRRMELLEASRRTILGYQLAFADFYSALVKHNVPLSAVVELTFSLPSETYKDQDHRHLRNHPS